MMDKKMKKILTALLLLVSMCAVAQTDSWRAYMSYSEPQQIVKGDNQLYVCASDNLYKYSLTDQSITTYDKIRQLSDTNIERIAWNPTVKKLIIVYKNKNIDLLFDNDEVFNISSYMNRTMTQDKTINALCIYKHYAYLCTAFGLVKINMNRNEVSESYLLNRNIVAMGVADDVIYIKDKQGTLLSAKANGNLIDPNSWTTGATAPEGIFDQDNSAWNQYYDTVKALQPGGPRYNTFFFMKYLNNCLTTVGGGWKDGGEFARPACVQFLAPDDETWTIIGKDDVEPYSATNFTDATCLAYDPKDATHFFLATCGSGVKELDKPAAYGSGVKVLVKFPKVNETDIGGAFRITLPDDSFLDRMAITVVGYKLADHITFTGGLEAVNIGSYSTIGVYNVKKCSAQRIKQVFDAVRTMRELYAQIANLQADLYEVSNKINLKCKR